eukprot:TRINITY_DN1225_c0_g1_i2.p1 TRINITY_DN1225_c0_g1~~TRINITY_DN1225_c0_g1_i2.p1  ORF type:complete len:159 (-),score=26.19 TRINITY_DN1225_c0_g1_i2:186-662(-)
MPHKQQPPRAVLDSPPDLMSPAMLEKLPPESLVQIYMAYFKMMEVKEERLFKEKQFEEETKFKHKQFEEAVRLKEKEIEKKQASEPTTKAAQSPCTEYAGACSSLCWTSNMDCSQFFSWLRSCCYTPSGVRTFVNTPVSTSTQQRPTRQPPLSERKMM